MKKVFFGILVATVATGGSVMSYASNLVSHASAKTAPTWFRYHTGDPELASSYTATVSVPDECEGGAKICAILAEPSAANANQPNVSTKTETAFKAN